MPNTGVGSPVLDVRPMSLDDLRLALSWAADEGWNPGLDDSEPFLAADPAGFFMGWLDGEPAVSIAAVAYGEAYGFIGLYICRPDLRGHAIGARLVRTALDRLSDRPVGIDGVMARVANYERLGFTLAHSSDGAQAAIGRLLSTDRTRSRTGYKITNPSDCTHCSQFYFSACTQNISFKPNAWP